MKYNLHRQLTRMKHHTLFVRWAFIALMSLLSASGFAQGQKPAAAAKEKGPTPSGPQTDGAFRKVILDADQEVDGKLMDSVEDPMEMAIAPDGRVFYAELRGTVKMYKPDSKETIVLAKLPTYEERGRGMEDGLLGITLDPKFAQNGWIYVNRSIPGTTKDENGKRIGFIRVSRFTLKGEKLDLASETKIIEVQTQREECCHVGGSMTFDAQGNLYVSVGDNTNPFASDGYAPIDEQPGRSPWDAQKSAANPNDLRGKIYRVHPEADGTYTIPKGNLFPPGTPGTRPEIYVMGNRNPFRISVDQKNGFLYWGEVGPDAGSGKENKGPAGMDEINQARKAGNFGWPYVIGDNKPYWHWDFAHKTNTFQYDPLHLTNNSPNNTGMKELPPAQPAFIYYTHGPSTRFPVVNAGGGRTAMAGPVYYFDKNLKSEHKLPAEFDHTLFIYEWSRNWIIAVHLDNDDRIAKMERFCPKMTFKRPMDMELGPDGCLYLIEFGTGWGNNKDTQIVRIEHTDSQASK
jgi:cytochrome c